MRNVYKILCALLIFNNCFGSTSSSVYIRNNTEFELRLEVHQSGYKVLTLGKHYKLYDQVIKPWDRKRVVKLSRFLPIKPFGNASYYFDIYVTPYLNDQQVGETFKLEQTLAKNGFPFIPAAISYGIPGDYNEGVKNTPWVYPQPFQVYFDAYRAVGQSGFQKLFDNIEYSFMPANYDTAVFDADPKVLRVLSYNICARPKIVFCLDGQKKRARLIPQAIRGMIPDYMPDVVVFQEAFEPSALPVLVEHMEKIGYFYHTSVLNKKFDAPASLIFELFESLAKLTQKEEEIPTISNGGVIIFSRHPIEKEADIKFDSCVGGDCVSAKGVKYALIKKGNKPYHIFGTHTNASLGPDFLARVRQYEQMRTFIDEQGIPAYEPVILAGDFNENLGEPKMVTPNYIGPGSQETNPPEIEEARKGSLVEYVLSGAYQQMTNILGLAGRPMSFGETIFTLDLYRNAFMKKPLVDMETWGRYGHILDYVLHLKDYLVPRDCYIQVFNPKLQTPWIENQSLLGKMPDFFVRAAIQKAIDFKGEDTNKKPLENPQFARRFEPSDHQPVLGYFDFR